MQFEVLGDDVMTSLVRSGFSFVSLFNLSPIVFCFFHNDECLFDPSLVPALELLNQAFRVDSSEEYLLPATP